MTTKKWLALGIYLALAIAALLFPGTKAAGIIGWIFIALPVIHVLEFLLVYKTLAAATGSMAGHFLHTLVFGFVHWLPLRQHQTGQ